jgi:lipid-binding SYLF domain-containing protein
MKSFRFYVLLTVMVFASNFSSLAQAENYSKAIEVFKKSPSVQTFFQKSYGYAIFPVIGKAGFVLGGALGEGKVYRGGEVTGKATLVKMSIGWQAGGQVFSEIIFFEDKRAYDEFTKGEFAFDATASAVAITAGVQAQAGTKGASAGATAGPATGVQTQANYVKGMAVFVHAKGGLMYEASIGGQKFNFTPMDGDN